jgi:hypothetical protein
MPVPRPSEKETDCSDPDAFSESSLNFLRSKPQETFKQCGNSASRRYQAGKETCWIVIPFFQRQPDNRL